MVSGVVLSIKTFLNSLGLDNLKSPADAINSTISCKLCSAISADDEHLSILCDAKSSIPRAHQIFA